MTETSAKTPNWQKMDQMIPAIVQHYLTGQILMQGYMNPESFEKTLADEKLCFFSRSRNTLWTKGETSGNYLELVHWSLDCDQDCLLFQAKPNGPTCHLGTPSCFDNQAASSGQFLQQLECIIQERAQADSSESYTRRLMDAGLAKIAQKVGEEGVECALAAVVESDAHLVDEVSDLFYHALVMLHARNLTLEQVLDNLHQRHRG